MSEHDTGCATQYGGDCACIRDEPKLEPLAEAAHALHLIEEALPRLGSIRAAFRRMNAYHGQISIQDAEITRLKSVIQLLVEAIEPFSSFGDVLNEVVEDDETIEVELPIGTFRRALSAKTKAEEALKEPDKL